MAEKTRLEEALAEADRNWKKALLKELELAAAVEAAPEGRKKGAAKGMVTKHKRKIESFADEVEAAQKALSSFVATLPPPSPEVVTIPDAPPAEQVVVSSTEDATEDATEDPEDARSTASLPPLARRNDSSDLEDDEEAPSAGADAIVDYVASSDESAGPPGLQTPPVVDSSDDSSDDERRVTIVRRNVARRPSSSSSSSSDDLPSRDGSDTSGSYQTLDEVGLTQEGTIKNPFKNLSKKQKKKLLAKQEAELEAFLNDSVDKKHDGGSTWSDIDDDDF